MCPRKRNGHFASVMVALCGLAVMTIMLVAAAPHLWQWIVMLAAYALITGWYSAEVILAKEAALKEEAEEARGK